MELTLKDRKAIKNGNIKLPGYEDGFSQRFDQAFGGKPIEGVSIANPVQFTYREPDLNIGLTPYEQDRLEELKLQKAEKDSRFQQGGAMAIQSGIGLAKSAINAFTTDMTADKYLANARTSEGNIGGIKYQRINPIYKDGKLPKYSNGLTDIIDTAGQGAAVGSTFGPWGAAIGGVAGGILGGIGSIFASDEEERIKNEARKKRLAINQFNFDGAMSTYLQMKEQQDLSRPMYAEGKMPVFGPYGPVLSNAPKDSRVSSGEGIIHFDDNGQIDSFYRIPGKKNNKDNVLFSGASDGNVAIIPNKKGLSDLAEIDPILALEEMKREKAKGNLKKTAGEAKNGKLPKCAEGWLPNTIINGLGGLIGLGQYLSARNDDVKKPRTNVSNPYEGTVLRGLAGLQYNPYPIINQMKNRQAYFNYGLANSGGLSGAQKYLGRIANANNMYRATADALTNLQERNIGLRSNLYNTMANIGDSRAQRMQQANQYDLDYYSKAHAAREQAMQMGLFNMLNSAQTWYANDFKRRQFNDMMNLYRQERRGY